MSQAILGSGKHNAEGLSWWCFHLCSVQPHSSGNRQTGSDAEACSAAPDPCGQPTSSALKPYLHRTLHNYVCSFRSIELCPGKVGPHYLRTLSLRLLKTNWQPWKLKSEVFRFGNSLTPPEGLKEPMCNHSYPVGWFLSSQPILMTAGSLELSSAVTDARLPDACWKTLSFLSPSSCSRLDLEQK